MTKKVLTTEEAQRLLRPAMLLRLDPCHMPIPDTDSTGYGSLSRYVKAWYGLDVTITEETAVELSQTTIYSLDVIRQAFEL